MKQRAKEKNIDLEYVINLQQEFMTDDIQQIKDREADERQGFQLYPNTNQQIIQNKNSGLFVYSVEIIFAYYSQGQDKEKIMPYYHNAIEYMYNSWGKKIHKILLIEKILFLIFHLMNIGKFV